MQRIVTVLDTALTVNYNDRPISTQKELDTYKFQFDDSWQGFTKTAVFYTDPMMVRHVVLLQDNIATIPWEVLVGKPQVLYIGVFGAKDSIIKPTTFGAVRLREGSYIDGVAPLPPTPDVYQQIIGAWEGAKTEEEARVVNENSRRNNFDALVIEYNVLKAALEQEIADGTASVDALEVLEADYAAKALTLETTYAPRLGSVESQLAETKTQADTATLKANAMASGSPKGVYATLVALQTAYPTGATGAYLVSADGKWYYWSGTAWTAGGTYQSTGIADKSISYDKTDFAKVGKNLFDKSKVTNGYNLQYTTGVLISNGSYATSDFIPIVSGSIYTISKCRQYVLFDGSKAFSSGVDNSANGSMTFTSNINGFLRFSVAITSIPSIQVEIGLSITAYEDYKLTIDKLIINSNSMANESIQSTKLIGSIPINKIDEIVTGKNRFNRAKAILNKTLTNLGGLTDTSYFITDFIKVTPGENIVISRNAPGKINVKPRYICAYSADKNILIASGYDAGSTVDYNYVVPSGVKYIIVTMDGGIPDQKVQIENNSDTTSYEPFYYYVDNIKFPSSNQQSELYGKSLLNFGDSIAAGDGNLYVGYAHLIAQSHGMTIYSHAVGGSSIARIVERTNIIDQVDNATAINPDYVLLEGITNDAGDNVEAGVITSDFVSALNENTFCGALESLIKKTVNKWVGAKILYVFPHLMNTRSSQFKILMPLAKQILQKWSIPYIDMYTEGGLNSNMDSYCLAYTNATESKPNGDGTHPNEAGYLKFYIPKIVAKMKSI